jgi:hypothetical protein
MPIAVACPCGVKLKAPDAAAGRRVKCPKCGNPLSVPAPAPAADFEMVDDDPPPVAAPAKKKPKLVDDDAPPTPTRKPPAAAKSKPKPVEVDDPVDEEDADEKPRKKAKARRDDDEGGDEKPKKKGKKRKEEPKSKLPLILGIGGGVVGLLVIVGIVVAVMTGGDGGQAKGTGGGTTPTQPAAPPLPAGWSTFKGDGFSVAVPDAIGFKLQDQPPGGGGPGPKPPPGTKNYTNGVPPQQGQPINIYLVGVGPVPPEAKAAFDKSPQDGWEALKKSGGGQALQDEKAIQVGGVEGRQFTLKAGVVNGVVRVAVKGDKIYSWGLMAPAGSSEDSPEVKPFFETFKFE